MLLLILTYVSVPFILSKFDKKEILLVSLLFSMIVHELLLVLRRHPVTCGVSINEPSVRFWLEDK